MYLWLHFRRWSRADKSICSRIDYGDISRVLMDHEHASAIGRNGDLLWSIMCGRNCGRYNTINRVDNETVLDWLLETYAFSPLGVMASRTGRPPTGIWVVTWFVAESITATESEKVVTTKSCGLLVVSAASPGVAGGNANQVRARVKRGRLRVRSRFAKLSGDFLSEF